MGIGYEQAFIENGYLAPIPILTTAQCKLVANSFRSNSLAKPEVWDKGLAARDRLIFDIATRPALIDLLQQLLGLDIILWGASIQHKKPDEIHHWHCDMESMAPSGKFVSIWIGLENTSKVSALKLVPCSHRFGRSAQEVRHRMGRKWGDVADHDILEWSRAFNPKSEIVQPDISNGDAIVFDGRLWHGSENKLAKESRTALLLQYAHADETIKVPAPMQRGWPLEFAEDKSPPVVSISGAINENANKVVSLPTRGRKPIPIFARSIPLPLERDLDRGWKRTPMFKGSTDGIQELTCHASVLEAGNSPHPPHCHIEEELLIVLDGEADIHITKSLEDPSPKVVKFSAGDMVYHPAYQHHTIHNTSDKPITYLMFKWASAPLEAQEPLGSKIVKVEDHPETSVPTKLFDARLLFEQETAFLSKLHSHITDLQPGEGYEPHLDDYDVAIILLNGQIATANETLNAPAVAFFAENELHGIHNPSKDVARYIVLEFHGEHKAVRNRIKPKPRVDRSLRAKLRAFSSQLHALLSRK